jgi:hypothetical protein
VFGDFQSLKPNPDEHRIQPIESSQLGHLLAVHITPADEQKRAQVQRLCEVVQQARYTIAIFNFLTSRIEGLANRGVHIRS